MRKGATESGLRLMAANAGLEVIFALLGVGELRTAAIPGLGGPGLRPGQVEVLAFATVVEDVQETVDHDGGSEFLAQLADQGSLQVLADFDASARQDSLRLLPGSGPPDGQQVTVRCDQQATDALSHAISTT
jgi:hypothetical protein